MTWRHIELRRGPPKPQPLTSGYMVSTISSSLLQIYHGHQDPKAGFYNTGLLHRGVRNFLAQAAKAGSMDGRRQDRSPRPLPPNRSKWSTRENACTEELCPSLSCLFSCLCLCLVSVSCLFSCLPLVCSLVCLLSVAQVLRQCLSHQGHSHRRRRHPDMSSCSCSSACRGASGPTWS